MWDFSRIAYANKVGGGNMKRAYADVPEGASSWTRAYQQESRELVGDTAMMRRGNALFE